MPDKIKLDLPSSELKLKSDHLSNKGNDAQRQKLDKAGWQWGTLHCRSSISAAQP
ncbi:hypothetical protein L0F63_002535 [Massospora cicadina]|nr:hypothetical protein L0F63_002535 [Massospora cicadina]